MFNMTKAEEELKLAWVGHPDDDPATPEGAIWDRGMTFTVWGSESDVASETAVYMIRDAINSLHSKFHIGTPSVEYPWWRLDLIALVNLNWLADYPDADNFAFPFMHSQGTFANLHSYSNPRADQLIEAGALMPDDTNPYNGELDYPDPRPYFNNPGGIPPDTRWPRRSIYYELQAIYVEDAPGFGLAQPKGRMWQQAWIRGWYYNPAYLGNYFYHLWKAQTHFGDANNDGAVDVLDAATISASWYPGPPIGPLGYRTQADLTGGTGGVTGGGIGAVAGIPDGKVDILDAALVSAYWDGPPQGPKHP
jgi:peptide/nickel transport system substrate-binding protein